MAKNICTEEKVFEKGILAKAKEIKRNQTIQISGGELTIAINGNSAYVWAQNSELFLVGVECLERTGFKIIGTDMGAISRCFFKRSTSSRIIYIAKKALCKCLEKISNRKVEKRKEIPYMMWSELQRIS